MSHQNNGNCPKCDEIINKYPGINQYLLDWFKGLQKTHPEAHISCAGRGYEDQTTALKEGTSRASYSNSAHNYNCALDFFVMQPGIDLYDKNWFSNVIGANVPTNFEWYGRPGAKFYELPHVEVKNWRYLVMQNLATLVEPMPDFTA